MSWDDLKRGDSPFGGEMPDFGKIWRTYKKWILSVLVAVLLAVPAASSFYTVHVNEEAVVLRLGKYLETRGPGLNFKLPFGIDQEHKREVKAIHKEEFGFRTLRSGVESEYDYDSPAFKNTRLMLTADLNCAELRWVVRYKIGNLQNYLFNVRNVRKAIRDVSEAVMRKIAGNSSIDEVLMTRQKDMEEIAKEGIQRLLDKYGAGIEIRGVHLPQIDPPTEVKDAFNEVNQAKQFRDQIINEAEAKKNRELIPAEGRKHRMISVATGYMEKRINEAEGDARAFLAVLEEYKKAKDITRRRLYLETMTKVLPRCGRLFLIDENQKGLLPFLRLDEMKGDRR